MSTRDEYQKGLRVGSSTALPASEEEPGQAVELLHEGTWHAATLIGCSLHADNTALAHVSCTVQGQHLNLRAPFSCLRLPSTESHGEASPAAAPQAAAGRHRARTAAPSAAAGQRPAVDQPT